MKKFLALCLSLQIVFITAVARAQELPAGEVAQEPVSSEEVVAGPEEVFDEALPGTEDDLPLDPEPSEEEPAAETEPEVLQEQEPSSEGETEPILSEESESLPEEEVSEDPLPEPDSEVLPEPEAEPEPEPEPEAEPVRILINEILPNPEESDSDHEFIELYNDGIQAVDMGGWFLDDEKLEDDDFYRFSNPEQNYLLEPGDYLLLMRSETDIVLNNDSDAVFLFDAEGREMDSIEFESPKSGRSLGRLSGNPDEWMVFSTPTPGKENILINDPPVPIIEIQKDSGYMKLNVTGAGSYDPDGDPLTFLWEFEAGVLDERENPLIYEYQTEGLKIIKLVVTDAYGVSASAEVLFTAVKKPVPISGGGGSSSIATDPLKTYASGAVVIDSALPNPEGQDSGNEKFKLQNKTAEVIDLSGWSMADAGGTKKKLPPISFGPEEIITISTNEVKLSLNNSDELLFLYDPSGSLVDEMSWESVAEGSWLQNSRRLSDGLIAQVIQVIDGDTVVIDLQGKRWTVRLIGVDAPETVHPSKPVEPFGPEASEFMTSLLSGRSVQIYFDERRIDAYGRLLAYVVDRGKTANEAIISGGLALAYTDFPFRDLDSYLALEAAAREAGLGMWYELKGDDTVEKEEGENEPDPEELLPEESAEPKEESEKVWTPESPLQECNSEFLKIESFLPNAKKGETTEYIKLVNEGTEKICLAGWQLDDKLDGGSKPFVIPGGAIGAGAVRTFRKQETGLALNNSNDCVNLIAPNGLVADQICYTKTHANEIFTHEGGDWQPKSRAGSKSSGRSARHVFQRDLTSYQADLPSVYYAGRIVGVSDADESFTFALNKWTNMEVSYSDSPINFSAVSSLLNREEWLEIQVLESGRTKNLISIRPITELTSSSPEISEKSKANWPSTLFLFLLFSWLIRARSGQLLRIPILYRPVFRVRKISG